MTQQEHYLDNSATTVVCPEAVCKVADAMTRAYGNPSSLHSKGLEAEHELTAARVAVAGLLGVQPREIFFTSGGTEANNLALFGAASARRRMGNRIVTTSIEHSSVLAAAGELEKQGFEVVTVPPGPDGNIDLDRFARAVDRNTILVSMMAVNNEVGSVLPIERLSRIVKNSAAPALVHVDAVQAFGKLPLRPSKWGIDLMTVSGHKIHAPKGVGALYIARGVRILPRTFGGEQEQRMRPGTEAVPLIAGFGAAVDALPDMDREMQAIRRLRDDAANRLLAIPGVVRNSPADALPYVLNVSTVGVRSETMLHYLAARGVFVSSGSACAKGRQSHVLEAMGLDAKRVASALRISFSRYNTSEDVDALCAGVREGLQTLTHTR